MITAFGSTYLREQTFSIAKYQKNKYCSRLSNKHFKHSYKNIDIHYESGHKRISGKNSTLKNTLEFRNYLFKNIYIFLHSRIN